MRPENKAMQAFLAKNGIDAMPKYISDGSLRGCWRLYNTDTSWNLELAEKLNGLGFLDFDRKPLSKHSGNGGMFSVFVIGHVPSTLVDNGNIYWRDVTPQKIVTDDGRTWRADNMVIYWHSHEATAAHHFLNGKAKVAA
jgi:hypothetical protein